jgi:uncharacterized protein YkwD
MADDCRRFLPFILLFLFATACSNNKTPTPTSMPQQVENEIVGVKSIQVLQDTQNPSGINVLARGQLPDTCSQIDQVTTKRDNNTFLVTITTSRSDLSNCQQSPVDFEKLIPLDVSGLPAGSYNVIVNGLSEQFNLSLPQVGGQPTLPANPTATPEPIATATPTPVGSTETEMNTQTPLPVLPQPTLSVSPTASVPAAPSESPTPLPTQQPTPSQTATETAVAETTPAGACTDKAAFYGDITIPDDSLFRQGDLFTKTWRIRNEGTCAWGPDYSLVFVSGESMSSFNSVSLPGIEPGNISNISVDMTAPSQGGPHYGNWEFQNADGQPFGVGVNAQDYIWVRIIVNWIAPTPEVGQNTGQPAGTCQAQRDTDYESQVLTLINNARTSQGLQALDLQPQLSAAALAHSMDMACNDFIDHTGTDGSSWTDRITAQGYSYSYASENIYVGNPQFGGTPQGAFDWWMNSQVHRDNILSDKITEIGIGYAYNENSTYGGYYTVDFATP